MSSLGSPSTFFLAKKKAYEVERSLRFNKPDTAYFQRTPSSASNRRTFTWSGWVKRSNLEYGNLFTSGTTGGNPRSEWVFDNDNTMKVGFNPTGSSWIYASTSRVFRDSSAWYHFVLAVDTTQSTSTDRVKLYVNGELETFSSYSAISQDTDLPINNTIPHQIGAYAGSTSSSNKFDGYMAEVNFIDGFQYDPSYFGATDVITGQWNPKKYGGSYGTNGFYLNFSDNSGTTATTLGKDSSGNGNNFTPNNFSVSAGSGNDSLEDTPTNNFPTINPLAGYSTTFEVPANGNLDFSLGNNEFAFSTFEIPTSGKWYAEVVFTTVESGRFGITNQNIKSSVKWNGIEYDVYLSGSIAVDDSVVQSSLGAIVAGNIGGIQVDRDAGTVVFTINGTAKGTAVNISSLADSSQLGFVVSRGSSSGSAPVGSINFGQRPFSHLPTGYQSLCSANLPDPTILLPNQHFNTVLYSGDGNSTKSITGVGFKPDWLWLKGRNTSYSNLLYDAVRGAGIEKGLNSNENRAEGSVVGDNSTYGYLNSFDSDGFSVTKGSDSTSYTNGGSSTYVAWNWNAGDTDGKTYTVTVVDDSGNKFRFDGFGTSAVTLDLAEGGTYIFNYPSGHPFRFSTTADGTHGGGSEYTTGVTHNSSTQVTIVVAASAPTLYYYCSSHSGMGGQVNTNSTLGSSNFDGDIQTTLKVNATAGFSIVSFTDNYAAGSGTYGIGHGLGVKPAFYIVKLRNATSSWWTWHQDFSNQAQDFLHLNSTNAKTNNSLAWGNTAPNSTKFYLTEGYINNVGDTAIAYCFSEVAGFSKFGSYVGNGSSSDGTFVFTGFRPAWIMFKNINTTTWWFIYDVKRETFNVMDTPLAANVGETSYTDAAYRIDILSNGFKIRGDQNEINKSGDKIVYFSFAESPFKNARAR